MINSKPTIVFNKKVGNITTFKKVTELRKLEGQIRREISLKGYVAQYEMKDIHGESQAIIHVKEIASKITRTDSSENPFLAGKKGRYRGIIQKLS